MAGSIKIVLDTCQIQYPPLTRGGLRWGEKAYIAFLPEWGKYAKTHGENYEEALENAKEVLEDLQYGYNQIGKPLPQPQILKKTA